MNSDRDRSTRIHLDSRLSLDDEGPRGIHISHFECKESIFGNRSRRIVHKSFLIGATFYIKTNSKFGFSTRRMLTKLHLIFYVRFLLFSFSPSTGNIALVFKLTIFLSRPDAFSSLTFRCDARRKLDSIQSDRATHNFWRIIGNLLFSRRRRRCASFEGIKLCLLNAIHVSRCGSAMHPTA